MNASDVLAIARAAAAGRLQLPSVPAAVRQLIVQLRSPDASVADLVSSLEQDPQLAARVLRLANTAHYAGRRQLASLPDAVAMVGFGPLRTLVVSCGLQAVFVDLPGVNLRQFWLDAGITARAARALGRLAGADGEAAFLAGLLHSSGHLILCQAYPQQMRAVLRGVAAIRGQALADAERAACGLDHPTIGAAWLDELGFPREVVSAVAWQLAPDEPPAGPLAPLLGLALSIAASVEAGDDAAMAMARLDRSLLGATTVAEARLAEMLRQQYADLGHGGGEA